MSHSPSPSARLGAPPQLDDNFDATTGLPRHDILMHLIDVFVTHFQCMFPSLDIEFLLRAAQERSGMAFLLNCVAAMAAR